MAKLTNLKPKLSAAPMSRLTTPTPRDERARSALRSKTEPSFRWYNSARWKKLRWSVLVRDQFTCKRCSIVEPETSRLICDHVTPHNGNETAFWAGPFQTLCTKCHSTVKQSEERRSQMPKGTWY